jgi:hypothetical protein
MGLFANQYAFEVPPAPGDIERRLAERCGLRVVIKPARDGWSRLKVPALWEGADLYREKAGWQVEYDAFPPNPFFAAHVDATMRELGGRRTHSPDAPIGDLAARRWSELTLWQRVVLRARLVRTVVFLVSSMRRR